MVVGRDSGWVVLASIPRSGEQLASRSQRVELDGSFDELRVDARRFRQALIFAPLTCTCFALLASLAHSLSSSWERVIFDVPNSGFSKLPWDGLRVDGLRVAVQLSKNNVELSGNKEKLLGDQEKFSGNKEVLL